MREPIPFPKRPGDPEVVLTAGEEALIANGEIDRVVLLDAKRLERRYGTAGPKMSAEQIARREAMDREWRFLVEIHYEALVWLLDAAEEDSDEAEVARRQRLVDDVRARMRFVHHASLSLLQEVEPVATDVLEHRRLEALAHAEERSHYRISARPFLHTDRWWEEGYVPEGAADLVIDPHQVPRWADVMRGREGF